MTMHNERDQRQGGGVEVCYSARWGRHPWRVYLDGWPVKHTDDRDDALAFAASIRGPIELEVVR